MHEAKLSQGFADVSFKIKNGELNGFNRNQLEQIDQYVEDCFKRGLRTVRHPDFHDTCLQSQFLQLQYALKGYEHVSGPKSEKPVSFFQASCLSFELREYLGGLSLKERSKLAAMAKQLLPQVCKKSMPSNRQELELLRGQIRLIYVYAHQCYRHPKDDNAHRIIGTLKDVIADKLIPFTKSRTILGSIYSLEAKMLRNKGNYPDCEAKFSDSIEAYTDWMREHRKPEDLALASYKTAMALGGIAWCKNMRGFTKDARNLINAARLLINRTNWELDKAHLDMIYADISRTFVGEDPRALEDVIRIAERSYEVFKNHPHHRLHSRASFTLALLHYYAQTDNYKTSEGFLKIVESYSKKHREARWLSNAFILLARIRNKQGFYQAALDDLLPGAIQEAESKSLNDRLVVAYIVQSESHLGLNQTAEAIAALQRAQRVNERFTGKGEAVNSERNKGWIFLQFALTYLRDKDLAKSRLYLDRWNQLGDVGYQWLSDFAVRIADEHTTTIPDFVISHEGSLNWTKRRFELLQWLMAMSRIRTDSGDYEVMAKEMGVTARYLRELREPRKEVKKGSPRSPER